jgi:mRNA interferase MazF
MRRGEIWTVAGGAAYTGKPRPAIIIQDDRFDANDSIVVCPLTTDPTPAPLFRLPIPSNARTGLRAPCRVMVDKVTTVPRRRLGARVGRLSANELKVLNRAIFVFLASRRQKRRKRNIARVVCGERRVRKVVPAGCSQCVRAT